MSTSSQEPTRPIDMNTEAAERTSISGTDARARRTTCPRAARVRAIHDLVRSNGYHVPAGLVAERMLEQAIAGKEESED